MTSNKALVKIGLLVAFFIHVHEVQSFLGMGMRMHFKMQRSDQGTNGFVASSGRSNEGDEERPQFITARPSSTNLRPAVVSRPRPAIVSNELRPKIRPLLPTDVESRFSRSGGPGGQNVNKVNTKAELRLDLGKAKDWIPDIVLLFLRRTQASRINKDDVLVVTSTSYRTQSANSKDALEKMQAMINEAVEAAAPPKQPTKEKLNRIKKLKRSEDLRRKDLKMKKSTKKKNRQVRVDY